MATLGNSPNTVVSIDYSYIATAGQTVITGLDKDGKTLQFNTNRFDVFVNGRLIPPSDYVTGVSTITLNYALVVNDFVTVRSYGTWQTNANLSIGGGVMTGPIDMATNALNNVGSINGAGVQLPYRNKIIDPNFDFWTATSGTGNGYVTSTLAPDLHVGATKTASQQLHTLGQTAVPGEPTYFHRTVVSGAGSASTDYCAKVWNLESVRTLAGKTATVTIWGSSDVARNMAIDLAQVFGTGGSPSASVTGIGARQVALTTGFQKISFTVNIPSISGKTLGSNNNDYLQLTTWFSAGTSFSARTASLPLQTGTFNISRISVVEGDATGEADPTSVRHPAIEQYLVTDMFETVEGTVLNPTQYNNFYFKTTKRRNPAITPTFAAGTGATFTVGNYGTKTCILQQTNHSSAAAFSATIDQRL